MTMPRTMNETVADKFDCDLYSLQCAADRAIEQNPAFKKQWDEISLRLSQIRPTVRRMMSEEDREATS